MAELDDSGKRLLRLLVSLLPAANPDRPDRMIGYKGAHERLGLNNIRGDWGASLKAQGLENLAEWTKEFDKPAITGIIVNQQDSSPGKGYFSLFGRSDADWTWWREQVQAAKDFDWQPYLGDCRPKGDSNYVTVRSLIERVLSEYRSASAQPLAAHDLAEVIRTSLPQLVATWIGDADRYVVRGSPGQGVWAAVPWVAVTDRLITETVQSGYYLVYLFNADASGVHLSLNQGVTTVKDQYGSGSVQALKVRAQDFLSRLGSMTEGLSKGPIDLKTRGGASLGSLYEAGSVCSAFYSTEIIPSEKKLREDFGRFIVLYQDLAARDERLFMSASSEDDEEGMDEEDARTLREHKRIERNRKLANKAKKFHGYVCKACGFDFEERYGEIGKGFIEAHHLVPLSKLKGQKVSLSAEWDFTVLCSNCHRMIHKTGEVGNVRDFRLKYLPKLD